MIIPQQNQSDFPQRNGYGKDDLIDILDGRRSGRVHRAHCPNCNPDGQDHSGRALIIFDDGGLQCHRCDATYKELLPLIMGRGATFPLNRPKRPKQAKQPNTPKLYRDPRQIEAVYDYVDPKSGELLYQKVRFSKHGKLNGRYRPKYIVRHQGGDGRWYYGLPDGTQRVLYNAFELADAPNAILVEGEKDADRVNAELRVLGLYGEYVATTTHDGAKGRWHESYSDELYLKQVIILPDNDEAGLDHADKVGSKLKFVAYSVKRINLTDFVPDLKRGGDVSDFLDAEHPLEAIITLATINRSIHAPTPANRPTTSNNSATPIYITRKAEKCECDYCQCQKGSAVTFYEGHTQISPMGSAPIHVCKVRLHREAVRWAYQIEDEQLTETIYMREMSAAEYAKWNSRNRQNRKRSKSCHRYRPLHLANGNTLLFSTDATDSEVLTSNLNHLYDLLYPLLQASDPNRRNRGTADWGGNYQGSKGNGKRKAKIRKHGEEAAGKCAPYLSTLSPQQIAKRLGIKTKGRSKERFRIDGTPYETYEAMLNKGIDLRLPRRNKGAIDIQAIAGTFDEPNEATVTDKGDTENLLNPITLIRDNITVENTPDDEIESLISSQSRFPDDLITIV